MKRKRYSALQIVAVLKQAEMGMPAGDLIRQTGITELTFYRWKNLWSAPGPQEQSFDERAGLHQSILLLCGGLILLAMMGSARPRPV